MTEKSKFATNLSPLRVDIVKLVKKTPMTAAQVASNFEGYSRDRMRNIMRSMVDSKLLSRIEPGDGRVLFGPYKAPPKPPEREMRVHNGTMKTKLNLSWMTQPARVGATDAFKLQSRGF